MKDIKLKKLEESYESGAISKEEYEKQKKEIHELPDEKPSEEKKEPEKEVKFRSDIMLIILVVGLLVALGILFSYQKIGQDEEEIPKTIDQLHEMNLNGELDPEQGYLYNGVFSFVKVDDVWYTKLQSPTGQTEFSFNFRYSPRELENITIEGELDREKFNDATEYFVTFNPLGKEFSHIRLARFDYDTQMIKIFKKTPKSACDRDASNQTDVCNDIPIITCENTDEIVLYFVESEQPKVEYRDNCIIVQGKEFDFVKGVDRILYNFYNIMDQ